MDKEMMAKVEEFVKEYSKRELNMEEMEQVVGGELDGLYINGKFVDKETVYNLYLNMTDVFGFDIAADNFCNASGFSKNEIRYLCNGNKTPKEKMYCLITQCFTTFDKIQNGGRTF